jgi:type II secretory pathway component PulL
LSLPLSSLNFRVIDLPFPDKNKIREILPFELDNMILGGSDRVVFDSVIVGTSGNKYQVLAVYIEKAVIKQILEKLKSFNIDPEVITSIELRNILKDFSLEKVLAPAVVDDQNRMSLSVEELKAPTINLRRDEVSFTRDIERTKKSLRVTAILLTLLALVLSADLLLKIVYTRYEIASLKKDIRKVYQEVFPGEKNIINELYQLKAHMKELKDREEFIIGVDPLNLLLDLSGIDKQGVVFDEITADRGRISLKGEAKSLSYIQEVKTGLERIFSDVDISDTKSSAEGKMLFTITAKEKT